jgi:hypothetical protein
MGLEDGYRRRSAAGGRRKPKPAGRPKTELGRGYYPVLWR